MVLVCAVTSLFATELDWLKAARPSFRNLAQRGQKLKSEIWEGDIFLHSLYIPHSQGGKIVAKIYNHISQGEIVARGVKYPPPPPMKPWQQIDSIDRIVNWPIC